MATDSHVKIGHEVVGSGPTKVMVLHGWFGDHGIWEPTYPFLDRERFSYAFMDYRGYGASRDIVGDYGMKEIASDALALASALGWERFSVIGHSMGGMAAQRLAATAPDRVSAVIGVTPVPASGVPFPAEVRRLFESACTEDAAALAVIETSLGNRLSPAVARHVLALARRTTTPQAVFSYLDAFSRDDDSASAKGLATPMLVLVGRHDGGITEDFARAAFPPLYPQACIDVLENSGHYPMLEVPAHLVTRMEHFLQSLA